MWEAVGPGRPTEGTRWNRGSAVVQTRWEEPRRCCCGATRRVDTQLSIRPRAARVPRANSWPSCNTMSAEGLVGGRARRRFRPGDAIPRVDDAILGVHDAILWTHDAIPHVDDAIRQCVTRFVWAAWSHEETASRFDAASRRVISCSRRSLREAFWPRRRGHLRRHRCVDRVRLPLAIAAQRDAGPSLPSGASLRSSGS